MSRIHSIVRSGSMALGVLALAAAVASAQSARKVVLTPYVGAFMPASDIGSFSASEEGTTATAKVKHKNTLVIGGNGSYWFSERWGMEFGAAYSPSDAKVTYSAPVSGGEFAVGDKEHAHVWLGTAKAMLNLTPASSAWRVRLGAGPAVIAHGGKAYRDDADQKVTGKTNYGGAFSLCTRIPLTGPFAIRLRAEDYVYQSNVKVIDKLDPTASFNLGKKTQNDFVLSMGLQFGFTP